MSTDAEDSSSENGQDEIGSSSGPRGSDAMSKSHQTGLAKLPNGLEWLMNAIGGNSGGANSGTNNSQAEDTEPAPKFLIFAHHKYAPSRGGWQPCCIEH